MSAGSFRHLVERVRAGDSEAAAQLVSRYEPAIRCAARVRLSDPRLRRLFDSMDICQSVFASFFVRAALGQYELETPRQLMALLAAMARNKLANHANAQRAAIRDYRRVAAPIDMHANVATRDPSPSREVAARELLDEAKRLLSPDERTLFDRRERGDSWETIATQLSASPDAVRQRLNRAINRIAERLELDEVGA